MIKKTEHFLEWIGAALGVPSLLPTQLFRFGVSGGLSLACFWGAALSLVEWVVLDERLATFISFIFGMVVSYLLQSLWTFNARLHRSTFIRYALVALVTSALASFIMAGIKAIDMDYRIGLLIISIIVPIASFVMQKYFVYTPSTKSLPHDG